MADALDIIRQFEGCRLLSYQDKTGRWTVGWGSAGPDIGPNTVWTQQRADRNLAARVAGIQDQIAKMVNVPLTDNQLSALTSLVYNIGAEAFSGSTVLRDLNAGDFAGAADAILLWDKDHQNGQLVQDPVLVNRRHQERALFLLTTQEDT